MAWNVRTQRCVMPTLRRPTTPDCADRPVPGGPTFLRAVALAAAILGAHAAVFAAEPAGSPHGLPRPGADLCELCHLPARTPSGLAFAPLWDRSAADVRFTVFGLPGVARTTQAGQRRPWPGAATRLCVGCHDGLSASLVIDRGARARARHHVTARARDVPGRYIEEPLLPPSVSRGVIDEHPVFIPYPKQPFDAGFHVPPTPDGWSDVKLVDGQVECVSCHDVHSSGVSLRRSNAGSGLCLTCHRK